MDGGIRRVSMDRDLQPVRLNARPVMAEYLEAACDAVGQNALIGARAPLPEVVTARTKRCEQGDEKQVTEHVSIVQRLTVRCGVDGTSEHRPASRRGARSRRDDSEGALHVGYARRCQPVGQ